MFTNIRSGLQQVHYRLTRSVLRPEYSEAHSAGSSNQPTSEFVMTTTQSERTVESRSIGDHRILTLSVTGLN